MMRASALKAPKDDLREEVSELRTELERLAGELEEMRSHAATLESLALEDPLTGLLNRRGFMRDLSRAIAYRARYDTPIALLMSDLDRFKPINDTYGHEAGDAVLKAAGERLVASLRPSDTAGRLGGTEMGRKEWYRERQGGVVAGDGRRHAAAGRRPDPDALDLDRRRGARGRRHPGAGADAGRPGDVPPEGRAPGEARLTPSRPFRR